jgi:hypothetical protein
VCYPIEEGIELKIELGRANIFKKDIVIGNTIKLNKKTNDYIDFTAGHIKYGKDKSVIRGERVSKGIRVTELGLKDLPE